MLMVSGGQSWRVGQVPRSAGGLRVGAENAEGPATFVSSRWPPPSALAPQAELLRTIAARSEVVGRILPVMTNPLESGATCQSWTSPRGFPRDRTQARGSRGIGLMAATGSDEAFSVWFVEARRVCWVERGPLQSRAYVTSTACPPSSCVQASWLIQVHGNAPVTGSRSLSPRRSRLLLGVGSVLPPTLRSGVNKGAVGRRDSGEYALDRRPPGTIGSGCGSEPKSRNLKAMCVGRRMVGVTDRVRILRYVSLVRSTMQATSGSRGDARS